MKKRSTEKNCIIYYLLFIQKGLILFNLFAEFDSYFIFNFLFEDVWRVQLLMYP